jgi:hypothetical protein
MAGTQNLGLIAKRIVGLSRELLADATASTRRRPGAVGSSPARDRLGAYLKADFKADFRR